MLPMIFMELEESLRSWAGGGELLLYPLLFDTYQTMPRKALQRQIVIPMPGGCNYHFITSSPPSTVKKS